MDIVRRAMTLLRLVLLASFVALVGLQTLSLPGQFAHLAEEEPDQAYLRWPLTVFAAVEILCLQVVIVCTWKLLTMVEEDRIFSEGALRWVDLIIGAMGAAWLLLAGFFVWVGFRAEDPGPLVVLMVFLLGGASFALLMVVLRTLLQQATTLRTDMEAVI
jgi:hypothetical protein